MKILTFFLSFFVLGSFLVIDTAFGDNTYQVKIPTGAADPQAPYFWQSIKDGSTDGDVEILIGDTIKWSNSDTAAHTVTSGTPQDGPDDIFDSGLFPPGQSFEYQFTEIGQYPYFCIVHPWMVGTITVTEGFSVIPDVGKTVGDGTTTFDVEYDFNRLLYASSIDVDAKSITFEIVGNAKSAEDTLHLRLPSGLIDGPYVIWIDGKKIDSFTHSTENDINVVEIEISRDSKLLTIVGTSVVPEFGLIALMIFGAAISASIVLSKRTPLKF